MRHATWIGVLLLLAASAWIAERPVAAQEEVDEETAAASAKVPSKIPDEARKLENPFPADEESIEYGKLIYSSQCTLCHGATGDGSGPLATKFKYDMPDLGNAQAQNKRTDGELFYVLTHGHGKMKGEGDRLKEKVRWDIVNYIRTLAK